VAAILGDSSTWVRHEAKEKLMTYI
jgi:hypothetical protein